MKIWRWIKKNYDNITEKDFLVIGGIIVIVIIGCLITLGQANKAMIEYTEKLPNKIMVDKLQKQLDSSITVSTYRIDSMYNSFNKLKERDKDYILQIMEENNIFEKYKIKRNEEINSIRNVPVDKLHRDVTNFQELR